MVAAILFLSTRSGPSEANSELQHIGYHEHSIAIYGSSRYTAFYSFVIFQQAEKNIIDCVFNALCMPKSNN
jgi:hypothetical protein